MANLKPVMKGSNEIVPFDHPYIQYPQLASTKMDGFRLLNLCGEKLLSPALKPFPNNNMTEHLGELLNFCLKHRIVTDGEFWSPVLTFQQLQSLVRSHDKSLNDLEIKYYIFDAMTEEEWDNNLEKPFIARYLNYKQTLAGFPNVVLVEQQHVTSAAAAQALFDQHNEQGHEGIILRQHSALYKHGRCTLKQDGMWKF